MGKPVLASAQDQICELIKDGVNGLLYPPGNKAVFLEKLHLLIANKDLRRSLGLNARQIIERGFTWEDNARRVLRLCEHISNLKREKAN